VSDAAYTTAAGCLDEQVPGARFVTAGAKPVGGGLPAAGSGLPAIGPFADWPGLGRGVPL